MDFKKAYEAALERAKGIYNENPSSSTAKFVCGQIFPEIKESDDERTRNEIINYLSNELHNVKQLTPRTNEFEAWISYLEKQNAEFLEYGRQEYLRGRTEAIDEQQPAGWSNEDELHLKNAILAAEREWGADSRTAGFLKSLRPQPHWKPSEEQIEVLNEVVGDYRAEDTASCEKTANILESLYNDLESL